jgi:pimeloyl-ACP methyl ester carboxylesterase
MLQYEVAGLVTMLCLTEAAWCQTGLASPEAPTEAPCPARVGFAEVREPLLYYEETGSGPPVILIHGGWLGRRMWDEQFVLFSKMYRVVRYDMRGFGKSAMPTLPYSNAKDLRDLLHWLQIDKAHIVGFSDGGRIAIDFALTAPEMVRSLVLVGPGLEGFPYDPEGGKRSQEEIRLAREESAEKAADFMLKSPYVVPAMENPRTAAKIRRMTIDNMMSNLVNPLLERPLRPAAMERLRDIHAPTLVMVGTRDTPDSHKIVEHLERKMPDIKRIDVEGSGHVINMEKPEAFNRAVIEFLARH